MCRLLHAGAGISAISSVPYAFSEVFPVLTLGTWTYIFQGVLVLSLMVLQRQFVPSYLCSFVVAVFGDLMVCAIITPIGEEKTRQILEAVQEITRRRETARKIAG